MRNICDWYYESCEIINSTPSTVNASFGLARCHFLDISFLIMAWSIPTTVTEVRSFLGLAGYYRRFVKGFSKVAKPMTSLLEKGREFKWDEKCQDSFDQLKKRLMSPLVLVMPDLQKGFDIYCDACGQGLGCVLMQGHVIAYASR
jgi:hypothetical protein